MRLHINRVNKMGLASRDGDTPIGDWADVDHIPSVGELINIDGEPYYVVERDWAFETGKHGSEQWCYLRVK